MSFLTSRVPLVARRVHPAAVARFSTSPYYHKSPVEAGKDALKAADRTVSDAAVKGIETGEQAAQSAKEAIGMNKGQVKGKAEELKGQAMGKAEELKGEAKGKAEELKGEAKSKLS